MPKRALFATACLMAAALVVAAIVSYPTLALDGVSVELLLVSLPDRTSYADGYTASQFRQIGTGMSDKDVLHLLGEPLFHWSPRATTASVEVWCYSSAGPYARGSGRVRDVFLKNGVVVDVRSGPWID